MPSTEFMRQAIEKAREGMAIGQTPFGACIVRGGRVAACEHNGVWATQDATAHAEVQAIRTTCKTLGTVDLTGTVIYSTCEPCPMCFSAIHWAKVSTIVFGARIADAQALGFSELTIPNDVMKREGGSPVELVPGFLRDECLTLFREFAARPDRRTY
jgi:tRNA(Arg) A34 adenosine deaminase TadA